MSSYKIQHRLITNTIKRILENDSRLAGVKEIIIGEKERIGALVFPCIFIVPGRDEIKDEEMPNRQEHAIGFNIVCLLKDRDLQAGMPEVVDLGGDIHDVFKENRDLQGTCLYLDLNAVDPGYGRGADNKTILHYCSVEITVHFIM